MRTIKQDIVLIVDDQPPTIHSLAEALREYYKVLIATNGEDALELARNKNNMPDIILLDIKMPGMNGYEVCKKLKNNPGTKNIPVIFITILDEPKLEKHGLSIGAVDYITKPINIDIVLARVETHLELKAYRDDLEYKVEERTKEVETLNQEIISTQKEVIFTLGDVVETRSKETANHVQRVSQYIYFIACNSGLDAEEAKILKFASPMHDVGKIGIPEAILNKPGKLTEKEREIIKTHAKLGYDILKKSDRKIFKAAAIIAYQHHEWWDGNGYPRGLKRDDTHIYGRIAAVADVFDALATERPYKRPWSKERIINEFKIQREKQFDPELTDLFLGKINEFYSILNNYPDQN